MSAELLEDMIDDNGTEISLTVHAQSGATLSLIEESHPYEGGGGAHFRFTPTADDIAKAQRIVQALQLWTEIAERQIVLDADALDKIRCHVRQE